MYEPSAVRVAQTGWTADRTSGSTAREEIATLLTCLIGAGFAGVVLAVSFPMVLDVATTAGMLSSTVVAVAFFLAWMVAWTVIETTRERVTT